MDTYAGTFPYVNLVRFIINRVLLILRGDPDEAVHLLIRHHDIFQSCAFHPRYELQEIMVLLEIRDLFPRSMYEHEIRNDRYKPFGFHSVIDPHGIVFRYEILQALLTLECLFCLFLRFYKHS